ncbi:MAG TPA: hypothetical protein VGM83_10855 [Devosiaceae bacterium]|jgi:hypothetical protein
MTFNREQSEVVVRAAVSAMDMLDRSLCELRGRCSDEDYAEYGRKLDAVVGELTDTVLTPIFAQHPELQPETCAQKHEDDER